MTFPCVSPNTWISICLGFCQIAFDEDPVIAESGYCFALGAFERAGKILRLVDDTHAASAAAGRGLDEHRKPDVLRRREQDVLGLIIAVISGDNRNTGISP